jgi:hypothetical protein
MVTVMTALTARTMACEREAGSVADDDQDPLGGGRRPWFGPKLFGYGWSPQTWQGYLIVAAVIGITLLLTVGTHKGSTPYLVAVIPLAAIAIIRTAARRR